MQIVQIVSSSGKTFNTDWVLEAETRNGTQQLIMNLTGELDPSEVITELEGQAQIIGIKGNGNRNTYERYTLFRSLIVSLDGKSMRLTLERNDAA